MLSSCPICSDTFIASSNLVNTPCGHVFHHECVLQWFERSKTCPQCRKPATAKNLVRLYLNITTDGSQAQDPGVLVQTIDELKLKIRCAEKDVKNAKKEKDTLQSSLDVLKVENKNLVDNGIALESQISALRKYVKSSKNLEQDLKFLRHEKQKVDTELQTLKSTSNIIHGPVSEADAAMLELCDGSNSSRGLVTICGALKRDLNNKNEKLGACKKEAERCRRMEYEAHQKLRVLEETMLKPLKIEIEELKAENASLKKKVEKMQASIMSPTPGNAKDKLLSRLLHESPMPEECKPLQRSNFICSRDVAMSTRLDQTLTPEVMPATSILNKNIKSKNASSASARQPLGSKNLFNGKSGLTSSKFGAANKTKSSFLMTASAPRSSLFAPSRMAQLTSTEVLRKRLYEASEPASGMVYNGLGGTVRADPAVKTKKTFVPN